MIKSVAFAVAALLAGTCMAQAKTMCRTTHGEDAYYAYRVVDGKRCWYRGEKGKDKDTLFWKVAKLPRARVAQAPALATPIAAPQPQTVDVYRAVATGDTTHSPPAPSMAENQPIAPALQPVPLALASLWLGLPLPPHLQPLPEPGEWPAPPPLPQVTAKAPQPVQRGTLLSGTILTLLLGGVGVPIGFGVNALQRHVAKRGTTKVPAHWVPLQLKGGRHAGYPAVHG